MSRSSIARCISVGSFLALGLQSQASHADASSEFSLESLAPLSCEQMVAKLNTGLERKDPQALYSAGVIYDEGACVARDPAKAATMMRGAINAGHGQAAASLALLTGLGEGVPQDYGAAGALLSKAGINLGNDAAAGPETDYARGDAYTWLRVAEREFKYPNELKVTGTRGSADLAFEPRSGKWKTGAFRKSATTEDVSVGSRIDRSRGAVTAALDEAARAAAAKVPAPDISLVVAGTYSAKLTVAPAADDMKSSIGVIPIIGNVPRARFGTGS